MDLFQRVGGHFLVQSFEDCLALGGGEFFDDVGNVGGGQSRQALGLDAQLDPARRGSLDKVPKLPGGNAWRDLIQQGSQRYAWNHSPEQAANGATSANIDAGDP